MPAQIAAFIGAVPSASAIAAIGTQFATWVNRIETFEQNHWDGGIPTSGLTGGAVYERGKCYETFLMMGLGAGKSPTYAERGMAYTQPWLDYIEANSYGPSEQYSGNFVSLLCQYIRTGGADELLGIQKQAAGSSLAVYLNNSSLLNINSDNFGCRYQVNFLARLCIAWWLNLPGTTAPGDPGHTYPRDGQTWASNIVTILQSMIDTQEAGGGVYLPRHFDFDLGTSVRRTGPTFAVGYRNSWMIWCYENCTFLTAQMKADIQECIRKSNEFMWSFLLKPHSYPSFMYASGSGTLLSTSTSNNMTVITASDSGPTTDINCQHVMDAWWLHKQTGDPVWRTRGDDLLTMAMTGFGGAPGGDNSVGANYWNPGTSSKQFSEIHFMTAQAIGFRQMTPITTSLVPSCTVLPALSGSMTNGNDVSLDRGTWSNSPTMYELEVYCLDLNQKYRPVRATGTGTTLAYTLAGIDVGWRMFGRVRAGNASGWGEWVSTLRSSIVT